MWSLIMSSIPGVSYSRYDPNRGYYWEFPDETANGKKDSASDSLLRPDDPGETQRRRVDHLLNDLLKKFPPRVFSKKVCTALCPS